jgi:RNA polymerase sigma factor (sigma-70 family)
MTARLGALNPERRQASPRRSSGNSRWEPARSMDGNAAFCERGSLDAERSRRLGAPAMTNRGAARAPTKRIPIDLETELERLHPRSHGWALSCCQWNHEEAADVLQTSYLKVLDGRARFGGRSRFSTFLFGVIRKTAAEARRRRTTRSLLLLRHAREVDATHDRKPPPASFPVARLREALNALPRRQREILHLVFYDEVSIREAAEIMGIGIGSARVHYDRAKKKLRARLGEETREEISQ